MFNNIDNGADKGDLMGDQTTPEKLLWTLGTSRFLSVFVTSRGIPHSSLIFAEARNKDVDTDFSIILTVLGLLGSHFT